MALDVRSFFVGIATVLGILSVGFGGGVMMGGIISGEQKAPNKIERQAVKEPAASIAKDVQPPARDAQPPQPKDPGALARDLDAIKPASQPAVVMPAPKSEPAPQNTPAQAQAAPAPAPVATQPAPPAQPQPQTQPAPQPAPAPTMTAETPPQPAIGPQRQVSLPQPSAEPQGLTRREEARLRAQQRREERAQRRELRRQQMAERRAQEQQRWEAERAAVQSRQSGDDDDDDAAPSVRPMPRPRGLFGLFPF